MAITRKIDDLGRLAIPKEARKTLGWNGGDEIEMTFIDNRIILEKYFPKYSDYLDHVKQLIMLDPEVDNQSEIIAAIDTAIEKLK